MKNKHQKLADVRKALSSKQVSVHQSTAIRGGDGGGETFPWIDKPGE